MTRWRTVHNRRRAKQQRAWSSARVTLRAWWRQIELESAWFKACMFDPLVKSIMLEVSIDGQFIVAEPPKPATFVDPVRDAL